MKKLIIACALSVALSSAASAQYAPACPAAKNVLKALSGKAGDAAMSTLVSKVPGADSAFVPTTMALENIPSTSANCHYGVGTTNFLTIVPKS